MSVGKAIPGMKIQLQKKKHLLNISHFETISSILVQLSKINSFIHEGEAPSEV